MISNRSLVFEPTSVRFVPLGAKVPPPGAASSPRAGLLPRMTTGGGSLSLLSRSGVMLLGGTLLRLLLGGALLGLLLSGVLLRLLLSGVLLGLPLSGVLLRLLLSGVLLGLPLSGTLLRLLNSLRRPDRLLLRFLSSRRRRHMCCLPGGAWCRLHRLSGIRRRPGSARRGRRALSRARGRRCNWRLAGSGGCGREMREVWRARRVTGSGHRRHRMRRLLGSRGWLMSIGSGRRQCGLRGLLGWRGRRSAAAGCGRQMEEIRWGRTVLGQCCCLLRRRQMRGLRSGCCGIRYRGRCCRPCGSCSGRSYLRRPDADRCLLQGLRPNGKRRRRHRGGSGHHPRRHYCSRAAI